MVINPIIHESSGKSMDIFSKNLESRIIHLVGEINDEMSALITAQLLQLDSENNEDIYIYINSPGGSVSVKRFLIRYCPIIAANLLSRLKKIQTEIIG